MARAHDQGIKIVAFGNQTGEVVKEGSRYIHVRERHVSRPKVVKIALKDVRYLLGARHDFNRKAKFQGRLSA